MRLRFFLLTLMCRICSPQFPVLPVAHLAPAHSPERITSASAPTLPPDAPHILDHFPQSPILLHHIFFSLLLKILSLLP